MGTRSDTTDGASEAITKSAQKLVFFKAQNLVEEVRPLTIHFVHAFPEGNPVRETEALFMDEAVELEDALHRTLPGGTYDRLCGLMLKRKTSDLIVPLGRADYEC